MGCIFLSRLVPRQGNLRLSQAGLSQMQLQKSLEQYQKIAKSVVVQRKIGMPL